MPGRKRTQLEIDERAVRSAEWKKFMSDFLFTEKKLAEVVGISRRTVQMVKAGKVTPHDDTIQAFAALRAKHESERKRIR